jgi:hypothetical protein
MTELMRRYGDDIPEYESTQERHRRWKEENIAYLESVGAVFTSNDGNTTMLFREKGKPRADFYPHTGRWRTDGSNNTFRGGAKRFWDWYNK